MFSSSAVEIWRLVLYPSKVIVEEGLEWKEEEEEWNFVLLLKIWILNKT